MSMIRQTIQDKISQRDRYILEREREVNEYYLCYIYHALFGFANNYIKMNVKN